MKLEQQVCNLHLAQRLKELNVHQDSYFYWWEDIRDDENIQGTYYYIMDTQPKNITSWSAFTVAELLDILPLMIEVDSPDKSYKYMSHLWVGKLKDDDIEWHIVYGMTTIFDNKLPDALANMLIYLLEKGIITNGQEATEGHAGDVAG